MTDLLTALAMLLIVAVLVGVPWTIYRMTRPKQPAAATSQRRARYWVPRFTLATRQKKLIVLLLAATWISGNILRITVYHVWSPRWWTTFYAESIPALLFAGIFLWWYSWQVQ